MAKVAVVLCAWHVVAAITTAYFARGLQVRCLLPGWLAAARAVGQMAIL